MSAKILDGKTLAVKLKDQLKDEVLRLKDEIGKVLAGTLDSGAAVLRAEHLVPFVLE